MSDSELSGLWFLTLVVIVLAATGVTAWWWMSEADGWIVTRLAASEAGRMKCSSVRLTDRTLNTRQLAAFVAEQAVAKEPRSPNPWLLALPRVGHRDGVVE